MKLPPYVELPQLTDAALREAVMPYQHAGKPSATIGVSKDDDGKLLALIVPTRWEFDRLGDTTEWDSKHAKDRGVKGKEMVYYRVYFNTLPIYLDTAPWTTEQVMRKGIAAAIKRYAKEERASVEFLVPSHLDGVFKAAAKGLDYEVCGTSSLSTTTDGKTVSEQGLFYRVPL